MQTLGLVKAMGAPAEEAPYLIKRIKFHRTAFFTLRHSKRLAGNPRSSASITLIFIGSFFLGRHAEQNPWQANTLEWSTASPPPHGNFVTLPIVYRGPYEYGSPESKLDWLPQDKKSDPSPIAIYH